MIAWEKFKKLVEREKLIRSGDRILVAVSGGPDSVCLLHLLWRYKKTNPIDICAVTIDHGLRRESKREIEKVGALCGKLRIPLAVRSISVKDYARVNKVSTETAARTLRYQVLEETAGQFKCDRIATGHTANDNAETILMWLVRGTGTEGFAGIPLFRKSGSGKMIIRPLLSSTRGEVVRYARSQKLAYSIDRSNYSPEFTRNRIRHGILPLLGKLNPRFVEHLFSFSQIVSRDNEFINTFVNKAVKKVIFAEKHKISFDLKQFFKYNEAIQSRILKRILPEKRSAANVDFLRDWILFSQKLQLNYSGRWLIKRVKNRVIFLKYKHGKEPR
ncbi:MAG: tRNA lysidine(34) synthetase TilS [Elusimicrobiota bacterium]